MSSLFSIFNAPKGSSIITGVRGEILWSKSKISLKIRLQTFLMEYNYFVGVPFSAMLLDSSSSKSS
jgi:hypothetical protein